MRIWLSPPSLSGSERTYVDQAFESNFIAPIGPQLDAFEGAVAEYLGEDTHCVAVSSGTAALHLALRLAGVGQGDEVWVSSMTFAGGVFPISYLGATPRFFDVDPESWTIDPALVADELRDAAREDRLPKAIIPTDLYGQTADIAAIEELARPFGVKVISDSAESLGALYMGGRKAGSGGDAAILSFNGNKIITTSGGGMLVTRNRDWAESARFLATQARDPAPHYQHSTVGYNYRLSNISAAIGLGQFETLEARVTRRRAIFDRYEAALTRAGVAFMPERAGSLSTRWLTTLTVDPAVAGISRHDIHAALAAHQIESRPLWKPMHLQPLYDGLPYHGSGFDEGLFATGLCLPSGNDLTEEQQQEVIGHILALFDR